MSADFEELDDLTALAASLDPVAPPAFVKEQILAAIRTRTVRSGEGRWFELAPGVRMKKLSNDRARDTVTVLMEMEPGATLPPHDHGKSEDSFIISGSCRIGNVALFPGDFHRVEAGAHHETIVSEEGCLALLVMDAADYYRAA